MKQEQEIFEQAMALHSREAREGFLLGACGQNPELRRSVDELLAAFNDAGELDFLKAGDCSRDTQTVPVDARPEEGPGTIIGRYKLLQQIGEGGMGVVYMADQEEPVRRRVALKIIKLGMDTKSVIARFEAERQALALMDHPNIAKVLDGGTTEAGRPYFVMELVRGVKITEYCDETKLSTRDRLDLFIKVCQAIQHAHQKGIIHRDIKPSNILITINDGAAVPKVIDFGIAKATEGRLTDKTLFTQFEAIIGTPAYMSPEQAVMTSLDIDTRSDIYSLGVLLYELLAGSTPFDAKELMASGIDAMRKMIREKEPLRPSTKLSQTLVAADLRRLKPTSSDSPGSEEEARASSRRLLRIKETIRQLKGDLDWIVMKCLEKDRSRRYETTNGLAADLKRHLNNEAVFARPPSAAYRFQKMVQRNKLVFTAAMAVAVALVAGLAVSSWQMVAARRARNGEQQQRLEAQSAQKVAEAERQKSRRLLYASDIYVAQQTLKLNNVGNARRLLDRNRPRPGEEDLRGWEWRYLWQLIRSSALVTLTNRPTRGTSVSFSPDGTRLAVSWNGGRVDLWDVPGRRWVRALTDREYRHHQGRVAFSSVRNLLAATGDPDTVALHDLDTGQESVLWRAPEVGYWNVKDISFSLDGSKVAIYAGSVKTFGDAVWVVNVSSSRIEGRYPTDWSNSELHGAARLSPDSRRLYLAHSDAANYRYSIECLDLATGQELWRTEHERDYGLTTLALSPDGRTLASGSGFEDPSIRIWDAATGKFLKRLDGHTGWVCKLAFTRDGRRLISAASDQSIRFWDTSTWAEPEVLRGHTDEVQAVAISEPAQLIASAGKDGNLMLWKEDGKSAANGYLRLPEDIGLNQILPLNDSRVLLLPTGKAPGLVDLQRDTAAVSLPEIEFSSHLLGCFGTNLLCHWNETNQILVREWRGAEFIPRGAITLHSSIRPTGLAYNATRQILAWTQGATSTSVWLASLAAPGHPTELTSDVPEFVRLRFSEDGKHLAATARHDHSLRVWSTETGRTVAAVNERVREVAFAAGGRMLVMAIEHGTDHEIVFHDLVQPGRALRRVPGKDYSNALAVSADGGLVASATAGGLVRLLDPIRGELIDSVHGHLNGASCVAFSPDGRRLISTSGGREAVKLWDVGTWQELLTFGGTGSLLEAARWSADGEMILAGPPWQAWRAPSWEEITAAEAKERTETKQP